MSYTHGNGSMPSLRALQVFEAAARYQNFTAAGNDLGITQSAVSRQIADLEAQLGQLLFVRSGPSLSLTGVGRTLAKCIEHALTDLRVGVAQARGIPDSPIVTLSMLPSVAAKWFAPRLEKFTQAHANIDLRISASRNLVDFEDDGFDAAIRYGKGQWPNVMATFLGAEIIRPVCTPEYAARVCLKSVNDLLNATLLYGDIVEDWRKWFIAAGIQNETPPKGPRLGDDTAILAAILDHQGVALGRSLLVDNDLNAGRLITPFTISLKASFSYWFVQPAAIDTSLRLTAVRQWIIDEFDESILHRSKM
jgi:LysR family transcriptional regulator, glycine cleavage system transcriptional activator